jgi:hypothetical protein
MTPYDEPGAGPPTVDYSRTAMRPTWDELPGEVQSLVADLCGTTVIHAAVPVGSGFTTGYAGVVLLADGREVFVKAGGPANEHILPAYRREAEVLPLLPAGVPAPRLLATGEADAADGTWRVLVTVPIRGHMPGLPWNQDDLDAVHDACLSCVAAMTPAPPELASGTLADDMLRVPGLTTYFERLGAGAVELTWGQPAWVPTRAGSLSALVSRIPAALVGPTAGHGDLRADNVVIGENGRAWLVDWNWLCLSPAWTDLVGVLPLARADGLDVDALVRRSPLTAEVDPDDIDTWLATIAAFMLSQADDEVWPGGPPVLRVHQRRFARTFLDWLGARRGWDGEF